MFSLMNVPSISDQYLKLLWILGATILFLVAVFRTDNLLGQINYNLNSYKVIFYLMRDLKQMHKLNEKNYKKLAILSRSTQILIMDCGIVLLMIATTSLVIRLAILSGKIFWIWSMIILIPIFITIVTTATSLVCLYIIIFAYYTMIFDQFNHRFDLISDGKIVKRRKIINKQIKDK